MKTLEEIKNALLALPKEKDKPVRLDAIDIEAFNINVHTRAPVQVTTPTGLITTRVHVIINGQNVYLRKDAAVKMAAALLYAVQYDEHYE